MIQEEAASSSPRPKAKSHTHGYIVVIEQLCHSNKSASSPMHIRGDTCALEKSRRVDQIMRDLGIVPTCLVWGWWISLPTLFGYIHGP